MSLPPFSPDARCPKCGHDKVNTQWRTRSALYRGHAPAAEWLSRCCQRCGFIWDEAVIEPESS